MYSSNNNGIIEFVDIEKAQFCRRAWSYVFDGISSFLLLKWSFSLLPLSKNQNQNKKSTINKLQEFYKCENETNICKHVCFKFSLIFHCKRTSETVWTSERSDIATAKLAVDIDRIGQQRVLVRRQRTHHSHRWHLCRCCCRRCRSRCWSCCIAERIDERDDRFARKWMIASEHDRRCCVLCKH